MPVFAIFSVTILSVLFLLRMPSSPTLRMRVSQGCSDFYYRRSTTKVFRRQASGYVERNTKFINDMCLLIAQINRIIIDIITVRFMLFTRSTRTFLVLDSLSTPEILIYSFMQNLLIIIHKIFQHNCTW